MTASRTNHWKLGLFIVAGASATLGSLFWVGAKEMSRETVPFVTYFDESVEGLDIGSAVKMRGVTVGSVAHITFGTDRRLVEVVANLYLEELVRIGLGTPDELLSAEHKLPPGLHAQLASSGLMGPTFLSIDFIDGAPDLELPFADPPFYLPSTPSVSKSLEHGILTLTQELPAILEALGTKSDRLELELTTTLGAFDDLAQSMNTKLDQLDVPRLMADLTQLIADSNALAKDTQAFMTRADAKLDGLDLAGLQSNTRSLLDSIDGVAQRFDRLLLATERGEGPIGKAAVRTDQLLGVAEETLQLADLPGTLLALRQTLASLDALASFLERQPGALIRGRTLPPLPSSED